MSFDEYAHMPLGELVDNISMYQRINGFAEADEINEGNYVPMLK